MTKFDVVVRNALAMLWLLAGCETSRVANRTDSYNSGNPYQEFRKGYEEAAGKPIAKFTEAEGLAYFQALQAFGEKQQAEMRRRHAEDAEDRRANSIRAELRRISDRMD